VSPAVKRPSVKYLHGVPKSYSSNENPTAAYVLGLGDYADALQSVNVVDSDGGFVTGAQFRHWGHRSKMGRVEE